MFGVGGRAANADHETQAERHSPCRKKCKEWPIHAITDIGVCVIAGIDPAECSATIIRLSQRLSRTNETLNKAIPGFIQHGFRKRGFRKPSFPIAWGDRKWRAYLACCGGCDGNHRPIVRLSGMRDGLGLACGPEGDPAPLVQRRQDLSASRRLGVRPAYWFPGFPKHRYPKLHSGA